MLKILFAEIRYFFIPLVILFLLPVIFMYYAINNIMLFENVYFFNKYFWSMLIGLGAYGLVFTIWTLRKKESRDRSQTTIPISLKQLTFVRWFFGVIPFIYLFSFIELSQLFIPQEQVIFISRINAQTGIFFMFLASYDLIMNITFVSIQRSDNYRIFILIGSIFAVVLSSVGVLYLTANSILKPIPGLSEEFNFFLWALVLSLVDMFIYSKRKSYLI